MNSQKLKSRLYAYLALAITGSPSNLAAIEKEAERNGDYDMLEAIRERSLESMETITVGGRVIVLKDNTIFLNAECHLGSQVPDSGWLTSFERNGVAYVVPAGKKLVLKAAYNLSGSNGQLLFGYANSSFPTDSDGADLAGTSPVFMGGGTGPTGVIGVIDPTTTWVECGVGPAFGQPLPNFEIPAGKYPFMQNPNNGTQISLVVIAELQDA